MLDIIPSILTNDPTELEEKLKQLEGLVKRVQIDIIDGVFADNKAISPEVLENLETSLLVDIHLMTKEPVDWVEKSVRAMADRIIGQVEMMGDQGEFVQKVINTGAQVGLALDVNTPVSAINPDVLVELDVVLIMSVKAGFGGQEFQEQVLEKVTELLSYKVNNCRYKICVDGGINITNIKKVVQAGADEVVVGTSLFEGDIQENIDMMMAAGE